MRGQNNSVNTILYGRTAPRADKSSTHVAWWRQLHLPLSSNKVGMYVGWFENIDGWSGVSNRWYIRKATIHPNFRDPAEDHEITISDVEMYKILTKEVDDYRNLERWGYFSPLDFDKNDLAPQLEQTQLKIYGEEPIGLPENRERSFVLLTSLLAVEQLLSEQPGSWFLHEPGQAYCVYRSDDNNETIAVVPVHMDND